MGSKVPQPLPSTQIKIVPSDQSDSTRSINGPRTNQAKPAPPPPPPPPKRK
jgi:hypothetical protein